MKRFAKTVLTFSAVALLGVGAALAQGMPGGMGMGGGDCHAGFSGDKAQKMQQRMVQRHEQHQKELKAALKLTPEQEGAWKQFTEATQLDAKTLPRFDRAAWDQLTTPQRMDKMQALHKQRDERMNKHAEAVKQFYAALNPEQQKVFDAQHQRMHRGGLGGERGGYRHHHG
jgi:periplasmic protein CpxP/Spy